MTFLLSFLCSAAFSQQNVIDSLTALLKNDRQDTNRVNHLNQIAFELKSVNPDKVIEMSDEIIQLATKLNHKKGQADIYNWIGLARINQRNFDEARKNLDKAAEISKAAGYGEGICRMLYGLSLIDYRTGDYNQGIRHLEECLEAGGNGFSDRKFYSQVHNNFGNMYNGKGESKEAVKHLLIALKTSTELKDKQGIAAACNNLGNTYQRQSLYQDAIDHFEKAALINKESSNKNWLANNYVNMGIVYMDLAEFVQLRKQMRDPSKSTEDYIALAMNNYSVAMEIKKEFGDENAIAHITNNMAVVEMFEAKLKKRAGDMKGFEEKEKKALSSFEEVVKVRLKTGDKDGLAKAYINIGTIQAALKKYDVARKYFRQAMALAREIGNKAVIRDIYGHSTEVDSLTKDYRSAFFNQRAFTAYRDSIINEEDSKKMLQMRLNHDFEIKLAADSMKNAQHAFAEKLKHETELKHQRLYTYGGMIGFALMLIVAFMAFKAYRTKQTANAMISAQKEQVEKKQKEILDSIYYAKRIQDSLLPNPKYISRKMDGMRKKT